MKLSSIPRTVILLGAASFFNDLSSEMIYPILPYFLTSVLGAGALQLGFIEGFAESTASFLKVLSGLWTDQLKRRKPFILIGYSLAGISRPLIGAASLWPVVWLLRFFDRLGKGVRTSPRDALIADVTPVEHRGKAYGVHRSMDHAGAVLGPLVATVLLAHGGFSVRAVFFSAAVPAVCAVLFLLVLEKEKPPALPAVSQDIPAAPGAPLSRRFKLFLGSVFLFQLGGSTDVFLLLRLADVGVPPQGVAFLWSILHVIKMTTTYLLGPVADRVRRQHLLAGGWVLYTLIYLAFGSTSARTPTVLFFLLYGLYFGLTEPTERALISQWATPLNRGKMFGWFHGIVGLAALPSGLLFGFFWKTWGAASAFYIAAALSAAACILLVSSTSRLEDPHG